MADQAAIRRAYDELIRQLQEEGAYAGSPLWVGDLDADGRHVQIDGWIDLTALLDAASVQQAEQ